MKHIIICLACSVLLIQSLKSQDSSKSREAQTHRPTYSVTLNLTQDQSFSAHLMNIKDSSVFVFQKKSAAPDPLHKVTKLMYIDSNWDQYNYRFISSIKVHDKTLRTWTILTGVVVGAVAGTIIAKGGGSTGYGAGAAVVLGFLLGGGVGAVTGVIISSAIEKKYLINGDWKSFAEMKAALKY